ncbi:MAG: ferredoxin family protein [Methanoregulaceae archaeon]|nr:ferredoxin family protein [Methanoregulaceae archaeon]
MLTIPPPTIQMEVYIDRIFCNGCGECEKQCSMGVFKIVKGKAQAVHENICVGCFQCQSFCPTKAIAPRWIMRVS